MRILIPTLTRPHPGGAYTLLRTTGKGLRRRGHEVHFLSIFGSGDEPPLLHTLVRRTDRLMSGKGGDRPRDLRTRAIYRTAQGALTARIALHLAGRQYDAAFTIDAGATNALARATQDAPLGCTFDVAGRLQLDLESQGKITPESRTSRLFRIEERQSYRNATLVLAYPPSFAAGLVELEPEARIITSSTAVIDVERITPVADPEVRAGIREQHQLPTTGAYLVLVPGRLVARKGVLEALGILGELRSRGHQDVHLVFAGDGPLAGRLQEEATRLELQDHLHLLGAIPPEAMSDIYALADCVLLPAVPAGGYDEPQGLTTFEALAACRPVVASRLGGIPDIIRDGETGLLAAPGDVPEFARQLARLREDPGLGERVVAGGSAELRRRVEEDAHFAFLEEILEAVAMPGPAGVERRRRLLERHAPPGAVTREEDTRVSSGREPDPRS